MYFVREEEGVMLIRITFIYPSQTHKRNFFKQREKKGKRSKANLSQKLRCAYNLICKYLFFSITTIYSMHNFSLTNAEFVKFVKLH